MAKVIYNKKVFRPFADVYGTPWCSINTSEHGEIIVSLNSKTLEMEVKSWFHTAKKHLLSNKEYQEILSAMELEAYKNKLNYALQRRVFVTDDSVIYYKLSHKDNSCVELKNGKAQIVNTPPRMFLHDAEKVKEQVTPNLRVKPEKLPALLQRCFNMDETDIMLLALWLPTAFAGEYIEHELVSITGGMGSGKTLMARMLQDIISPSIGVTSMPKNREDMAILLSSNYLLVVDNISANTITKEMSNLLCVNVTQGNLVKRKLFSDNQEIRLKLNSQIIMTGVDLVFKEADVLDRTLMLYAKRLLPEQIVTSREVEANFQALRPKIVGACLKLLARAIVDEKPIEVPLQRMASSFALKIKIARQFGLSDWEASILLQENQNRVHQVTLEDNMVALCVIRLMDACGGDYIDTPTNFMNDIFVIADELGISRNYLPKKPNSMTRKLGEAKLMLEQLCSIYYTSKKGNDSRQIHIWQEC